MRPPEKRKPAADQATGFQKSDDRAITAGDTTENLLDRQALRLLRLFEMPLSTARAVAFLAYQGGR